MKKFVIRAVAVLIVAGAAWGGYRLFQQLPERQQQIATAKVRQGDVVIRSYARGELRAVRAQSLTAPNLFGTVQVTKLAPLGSFAKEKDLIVEFDDSEVRSRLEENQLEIEQIDEQIKKNEADLAIRDNQDQVELLRTGYSVRRAQLDVKRNELFSAIDARKNILNLEEAQRRLKQLESDIKSRREQARAQLAVLRENRNRALLQMQRERARLMQVRLLSPISGLVAIRQTRPMGYFFAGMTLPDIREGDQLYPGSPVADILDLSELEVAAKVGELDRANLHEGQDVIIQLDAVAGKKFHGKIKSMSGTASANVWSMDPAKKFDVVFSVDMKELLSGLGAKSDQIQRILATAEANRKKPVAGLLTSAPPSGDMPAMAPGGEAAGMAAAGGGAEAAEGGRGGRGGRGRGEGGAREGGQRGGGEGRRGMFGGAQMSEADRAKFRAAMEKELGGKSMRDLSPEERQKIFAKLQQQFQPGAAQGQPAQGAQAGAPGTAGAGTFLRREGRRGEGSGAGEGTAGATGTAAATSAGPPDLGGLLAPGGGALRAGFGLAGAQQFTEKELETAQLPPPPEENSQLDVLLRPGLLADVEIIVEQIPNAIHIPVQAVFDKEGQLVVYVKSGDQFDPRVIKPLKRSESMMVISQGLKAGETVALADPTAKKATTKKDQKQPGGSKAGLPVGGGK